MTDHAPTTPRIPACTVLLVSGMLLVVLLTLALPAHPQSGESLGVTPASHEVANAIAGETYVREITVQNEFDSPSTITLHASGDVRAWVSTSPSGTIHVDERTHEPIEIRIQVPEDAVDGAYEGRVHLTAEPKDQPEGSGASLRYAVAIPLAIHLGDADAAPNVSYGPPQASDLEAGSAPNVQAPVTNEGNARAIVEACARILPAHGEQAISETNTRAEVLPGETKMLTFETEQPLPEGRYRVQLLPNCEPLEDGQAQPAAAFEAVPAGSLDKELALRSIEHPPVAGVDRPIELRAIVENTGEETISEAKARFRIETGGELVAVIETDPAVVEPGERRELVATFTPEQPGRYDVDASVSYDGRQTEQRSSFLQAQGASSSMQPPPVLAKLAPYLLFVKVLTFVGWGLWRLDEPAGNDQLELADTEPVEH